MPNFLDRVLAGLALIVLSPLLALVAVLVRRDSGSPVIFRQVRVGQHGRPFVILKFRTMNSRAGAGPMVTVKGDPRVTPMGRRLRSSKLDETPQFWNVVRGDMALVGPRPEAPVYAVSWPIAARDVILSVRPGIFDPAVCEIRVWEGRREEELLASRPDPLNFYLKEVLPRKAEAYVAYVQSKSLKTDLKILVRVAVAVLFR